VEKQMDQFTFQQIELFLQQQYQIYVPAVVFEYIAEAKSNEFVGWDYDDLFDFFSHFGEIDTLEIKGKTSVILFKSFFDANTAREFLQNGSNFKDTEKNNFCARWFKNEDESVISDKMREKMNKFGLNSGMCMNGMNLINFNKPMNMAYGGYNGYYPQNNMWAPMGKQGGYMNNGMNNMMYSGMNCNNMNQASNSPNTYTHQTQRKNSTTSGNSNIENSNTSNIPYEERKGQNSNQGGISGKYTCRFEIQIENDKDFQVARRLIGAKGCNMKKIVELCGKNQDGTTSTDVVKLRLRGKGSGYKEGPFNKESEEPLHLCISSKFADRYKFACNLVQELVASVYEEYKKYCSKINKVPVTCLAIRREEGMSTRKKNEFDI